MIAGQPAEDPKGAWDHAELNGLVVFIKQAIKDGQYRPDPELPIAVQVSEDLAVRFASPALGGGLTRAGQCKPQFGSSLAVSQSLNPTHAWVSFKQVSVTHINSYMVPGICIDLL